ncbi:MAG: mercuric reductase [Verrucomicrobiota bacterium]
MNANFNVWPLDAPNLELLRNVHPADWQNPTPTGRYNLVVIGAGTAGLVTAAGAAGLGARVALIERHLLGGDCLNVGCVPSKCLIRSSRAAADALDANRFGIEVRGTIEPDFAAVMERLRRLRAGISPHDSAQRFRNMGVDVFLGEARFVSPSVIEVAGTRLEFRKAVIATGARAATPRIEGLEQTGFLTNESVFNLTERPRRLGVIGGGPIGCELAQAFHRLGSEVVLLHKNSHLLDREDAEAAEVVQRQFQREGIELVLNCSIERVTREASGKRMHFTSGARRSAIEVDEILVGAGRAPNVEGLGLEMAGIEFDRNSGVKVNDFLQSTNANIYAAGDVCMPWKFTHAADAAARIVIQNALLFPSKRLSRLIIPWCTYTDPEIAHVGIQEREAAQKKIEVDAFVREFKHVDRAIVDGEEEGFVKVLVRKGTDKIVGATIVARHAGEMISEISVAISEGIGLSKLAQVIHPYPTQAEAIKQVADAYQRTRLTPFIRSILERWMRVTR